MSPLFPTYMSTLFAAYMWADHASLEPEAVSLRYRRHYVFLLRSSSAYFASTFCCSFLLPSFRWSLSYREVVDRRIDGESSFSFYALASSRRYSAHLDECLGITGRFHDSPSWLFVGEYSGRSCCALVVTILIFSLECLSWQVESEAFMGVKFFITMRCKLFLRNVAIELRGWRIKILLKWSQLSSCLPIKPRHTLQCNCNRPPYRWQCSSRDSNALSSCTARLLVQTSLWGCQ